MNSNLDKELVSTLVSALNTDKIEPKHKVTLYSMLHLMDAANIVIEQMLADNSYNINIFSSLIKDLVSHIFMLDEELNLVDLSEFDDEDFSPSTIIALKDGTEYVEKKDLTEEEIKHIAELVPKYALKYEQARKTDQED